MPIYEYYCPECKEKFEKLCSLSQVNSTADCPRCKTSSKRVLSKFASFSKDASGNMTQVTGSSCSTCGSSNCSSCNN